MPHGHWFICVVMDYFTKWSEAYTLPDHEATLWQRPSSLNSSQGVKKTRTTPLRCQSDGIVERFNQTLEEELVKYCDTTQQDWDLWLPYVLMAYRSAEHKATGYAPASLMCNRELRLPMDLTTGRPPDEGLRRAESLGAPVKIHSATSREVKSRSWSVAGRRQR
ncbi:uncharacterized protein LOC123504871 [Portunus trituberculatus]|uniref:uncharacterized protein LOC123504871 n=1 Tax=Portunus trituberculatus TaxID=210409 RepID=UPI001E1CC56E|nr:uncharacterized protein LOC123504871 [Portunus trituberculatus]